MKEKDYTLLWKIRELRESYRRLLEKHRFYMNCLLCAKDGIRQGDCHYRDFVDDDFGTEHYVAEYRNSKIVVKCMSKELRELKYVIRNLDREIRKANI